MIPMLSSVNIAYGLLRVPRRKRFPRLPLSDAMKRQSVEALVMQAYFQLVRIAWSESASRSTSLARYGSYEVRLVERRPVEDADVPHLWVELHAKGAETAIDACGCDDLEAAAGAAEQLMAKAERLQNEILAKPGSPEPGSGRSGG
jgi:hypothetical protein